MSTHQGGYVLLVTELSIVSNCCWKVRYGGLKISCHNVNAMGTKRYYVGAHIHLSPCSVCVIIIRRGRR